MAYQPDTNENQFPFPRLLVVVVVAHEFVSKCHPADHDVTIAKVAAAAEAEVAVVAAEVAVAVETGTGTF